MDKFVQRTVKRSLGLPGWVCDASFYIPTAQGGLGLQSIVDELGNMMITHATKMLTSPDPLVWGVSQHSLDCTIGKRYVLSDRGTRRWMAASCDVQMRAAMVILEPVAGFCWGHQSSPPWWSRPNADEYHHQ